MKEDVELLPDDGGISACPASIQFWHKKIIIIVIITIRAIDKTFATGALSQRLHNVDNVAPIYRVLKVQRSRKKGERERGSRRNTLLATGPVARNVHY